MPFIFVERVFFLISVSFSPRLIAFLIECSHSTTALVQSDPFSFSNANDNIIIGSGNRYDRCRNSVFSDSFNTTQSSMSVLELLLCEVETTVPGFRRRVRPSPVIIHQSSCHWVFYTKACLWPSILSVRVKEKQKTVLDRQSWNEALNWELKSEKRTRGLNTSLSRLRTVEVLGEQYGM